MTRSMIPLLLVLLLVPIGIACADGVQRVELQNAEYSSTVISATSPVTKLAGSAATNTDALTLVPSEAHSVGITATVTGAVSVSIGVEYSDDGTNFYAFQPAVSATIALSASGGGRAPLSIPVAKTIRFTLGSDTSRAISYTSVVLARY